MDKWLIITAIIWQISCYMVNVPKESNREGTIVFNASLFSNRENDKIYSFCKQLSPSYVNNFVDISNDGLIYLKKSLTCTGSQDVATRPLQVFVQVDSFILSEDETKLVIIPLSIYFDHSSCSFQKSIKPYNEYSSIGLHIMPDGDNCYKKSELVTNIKKYVPLSILEKCNTQISVKDNHFAIQKFWLDLVACDDICIPSKYEILIEIKFSCQNYDFMYPSLHSTSEMLFIDIYTSHPETYEYLDYKRVKILNSKRIRRQTSSLAPKFERSLYIVNVPEEKEKGFVVIKLSATDPDKDELFYSMSAVLDARSQSMFNIDSVSGVVTANSRLDREYMDLHYFKVIAVDSSIHPKTASTTLQINIEDENDHSPIFELASYEANVRESIPLDSSIISVRATDQDKGNNAEIEYSILNLTKPNEDFRIDSKTGVITSRAQLDREKIPSYTFTIRASDMAPPVYRRFTDTQIRITVIDENDNYPQFTNRSYTTFVSEDISWSNRPVVVTLSATDSDEDLNAAVRYSIIGGNNHGHFQIDPLTGEISVISPLDYETNRNYRLTIRAQDAGSPPRSNTTRLLINIIDVNDNDPKFYNSLFQETVLENTPVGNNLIRIQAYDEDDGENALITYSIKNYASLDMPLKIDNETGWILVTRDLDREKGSLYDFFVVAMDNGKPPRQSSANVIIRVQDTNDNDPKFETKMYSATVSELDPPGTPVVAVTAFDEDEDPRLIFQITSGNNKGRFNIISQKNQGIISIAQPLDYKSEKNYVLSILVSDNGGRTDTATVYVNVSDANTHPPIIERSPYSVNIPEDIPIGSTVVVIEASDDDIGENAKIAFQMEDVPEFKIDPVTGAIVTTMPLDRELVAGYTIVVTAIDNGQPPLSDTTNVEIEITDVNDNAPRFKSTFYQVSIPEDVPFGTNIQTICATDDDAGLNGQIKYSFSRGDGDNSFVIDSSSGIIRTNKVLDRESIPKYELVALAIDSGNPPLSSSVMISVNLEDVNDNPPRFESERIKFYVSENSPIGTLVGELKAIDPDDGINAKVEYAIVGGSDAKAFSLIVRGKDTAELVTRVEMDFESSKKKYSLIVRASSLPLRNDVDVEVYVTDVNDNAPILKDFSIIFNNYKNHFLLDAIGKVPVFEADTSDKLTFRFLSGNKAKLLLLNETSGELKLSSYLNTNVATKALFEITVSDGLNEASALCSLSVNLITESMLSNSVTLRLDKTRQINFLSTSFNRFLDGLSAIIPCPKENIVIFSIQDGYTDGQQVLSVSFSARILDNGDLESFFPPQYLKERIYLNRPSLTNITGLEVLPFQDNLCVHEPCLNFEQCLSILKFSNASDFIYSESIFFRPINIGNTFSCSCPTGFTGMFHRSECDTEINMCFSNPCLNGGTCLRKESGYSCSCPIGFFGDNCEVNLAQDGCYKNVCKSRSECVKLSKGFKCDNCTYPQWSTPLCELETRSFTRGSYLTFSSIQARNRINVKMKFATRDNRGLLLYNGRYNEQYDFIALEILEKKLVFSFSTGLQITQLELQTPEGYLSSGDWNDVEVDYYNKTAILRLNCDNKGMMLGREEIVLCSNATTFILDKECSDQMKSCYRFLDLTGPFQLGGLPRLPGKFPIATSSFVGCISKFYLNYKLVDLNSYASKSGTYPGCLDKREFCSPHPCLNGGTCKEGWGSYICHCHDGFMGQDCSLSSETVRNFKGGGYLVFSPTLKPITIPWMVKFGFKTFQENGLILKLLLGAKSIVMIDIKYGKLRYTYESQSLIVSPRNINDGNWHYLEANWMVNGIWLNLDYGQYEANQDFFSDIRGLYISKVWVGGLDEYTNNDDFSHFEGCIQGLDIGNAKDAWLKPTSENNVFDGCHYHDPCLSSPCPINSACIKLGLGRYSCSCNPGTVGVDCVPVCSVHPCAEGSKCVAANNTRGYKCECDKMHTGIHCEIQIEERCPAHWWGYPVCGPCNCEIENGYDGDCNQTTGECYCQINHYSPKEGRCLDCNCYPLGSYSTNCDSDGQCQCRPGVIGRTCDSCASPLAEVTLNGCEVVYDGCPRAFGDGVWWERTPFGKQANQSCPSGSFGRATRECYENGWGKADIFECTSEIFNDLRKQLLLLEKNEFLLNTDQSVKIARDLKATINYTNHLYGNDIFIIYSLFSHLINYELKQSGLNLTHKQDRYFLHNILSIVNTLISPKYASYWPRISNGNGPENIIKLLDEFSQVLIDNKEDTFTEPFEIVTENLLFGLDTIGVNELWDDASKEDIRIPSVYLDLSHNSGPFVEIPKYNNYPNRGGDLTRLYISLKSIGLKEKDEKVKKAIFAYGVFSTLGSLLPKEYDSSVSTRFGVPLVINSPVILFNIKSTENEFLDTINPRMGFKLRMLSEEGLNAPQCGYWSIEKRKWSTRGCEITGVFPLQRLRRSYEYVNCSCEKIGEFAVFMDMTARSVYIEESMLLGIVTTSATLISMVLLAITFVLLCIIRGLGTNTNSIHRNIVFCIFGIDGLFMIGMKYRNVLSVRGFECTMMAIFLHYGYLAIFSWILVEAIHLYRMLTEIRDINHGPMRFYYFLGYGLPALIVGLSVGVKVEQYGHYLFCWLSMGESVFAAMFVPVAVYAGLCVGVFMMALRVSATLKDTVSDYGNLGTLLWLSIGLLPICGCCWVAALMASNDVREEYNYAYAGLSLLAAAYVFIGYCIINQRVRKNLKGSWGKVKGVEESSATRGSLVSRIDAIRFGISTSSTTSRSSVTKSSENKWKRRMDSFPADGGPEMDLASSHSSDEEEAICRASEHNAINMAIQRGMPFGLNVSSDYVARPYSRSNILTMMGNEVMNESENEVENVGEIEDENEGEDVQVCCESESEQKITTTLNDREEIYNRYRSEGNADISMASEPIHDVCNHDYEEDEEKYSQKYHINRNYSIGVYDNDYRENCTNDKEARFDGKCYLRENQNIKSASMEGSNGNKSAMN